MCNWRTKDRPWITGKISPKIYLAAYMIVCSPKDVFEQINEPEEKVMRSARPLIQTLLTIAGSLAHEKSQGWNRVPAVIRQNDMRLNLVSFLKTFKEWKLIDEQTLIPRLQKALDGIEEAIAQQNETNPGSSMMTELLAQRRRLKSKLLQLAGPSGAPGSDVNTLALGGGVAAAAVSAPVTAQDNADDNDVLPVRMSNHQLVHELLLDSSYCLSTDENLNSDEALVIRRTFEKAFWGALVDDLARAPPRISAFLCVLEVSCCPVIWTSHLHSYLTPFIALE